VQHRQEAEEAVQDAFVRLIGQWAKVSSYDDPEASCALGVRSREPRLGRDLLASSIDDPL
jgi:predicted RNA polymerase sigma factor